MNTKSNKASVAWVGQTGTSFARSGADQDGLKGARKTYVKPVLECFGDVRDITLGPTFGAGESGCEGIFKVGAGGCPIP